jgi:hypothetical protein
VARINQEIALPKGRLGRQAGWNAVASALPATIPSSDLLTEEDELRSGQTVLDLVPRSHLCLVLNCIDAQDRR